MPFPNEHSARLRDPDDFSDETFRRTKGGTVFGSVKIPKTIDIIWAKLKSSDKPGDPPLPQALRFPIDDWTETQARKWIEDNELDDNMILFEPAEPEEENKESAKKDKSEFVEGVRRPFGSPGGKGLQASYIVSLIPEHDVYVEPFAGSAAVFFMKEPSSREVLNDKDRLITSAFRTIKSLRDEDIKKLRRLKSEGSEKYFYKIREREPTGRIQKLHWFLYCRHFSVMNKSPHDKTGFFAIGSLRTKIDLLPSVKERLQNVTLRQSDFKKILYEFDSPKTFFFIDPPYSEDVVEAKHLAQGQIDLDELTSALRKLKGKFLLTVWDNSKNRKRFSDHSISTRRVPKQGGGVNPGVATRSELYVTNYSKESHGSTSFNEAFHIRDTHWVPVPGSGRCPSTHPNKLTFPGTDDKRCFTGSAATIVRAQESKIQEQELGPEFGKRDTDWVMPREDGACPVEFPALARFAGDVARCYTTDFANDLLDKGLFPLRKISEQVEKLTNERSNLRPADERNPGERCGFCQYFEDPDVCKIVEGPVTKDLLCDWIQSREVDAPSYEINDEDWEAFGRGMIKEQPCQHIVKDVAITPEGPLVMIEDTAKPDLHRFSLTKAFHVGHTTFEHHWTQEEVDRLIEIGRKALQETSPVAPACSYEPKKFVECDDSVFRFDYGKTWAREAAVFVTRNFCGGWSRMAESEKAEAWRQGLDVFRDDRSLNGCESDALDWFDRTGFRYGVRALREIGKLVKS